MVIELLQLTIREVGADLFTRWSFHQCGYHLPANLLEKIVGETVSAAGACLAIGLGESRVTLAGQFDLLRRDRLDH